METSAQSTPYIVSALKYRPKTFADVVGQNALTTTLKNAIAAGRLAHAYLFCGPRGVGKTTCARIFARTINCEHRTPSGEACGQCESCRAMLEQRSLNVHELDAASNNGVDDIRAIIDQVQIPPQVGKYKVFIIDEVHMLSPQAFNAFLKTLEEPPAHAIFVLATTEKHKILPTILSRCQIYDFARMEVPDIVAHLRTVAQAEGFEAEDEALNLIAQKADGGMRDALSIFDQVASFSEGKITYATTLEDLGALSFDHFFRMTESLHGGKVTECLLQLDEVLRQGHDAGIFVSALASHLRDLLVSRDAATLRLLDVAESVRPRYAQQALSLTPRWIFTALRALNDCDMHYRESRNKRLLVEVTLIQIAQLAQGDDGDPSGRCPKELPLHPLVPASQDAAQAAQSPLNAGQPKIQAAQPKPDAIQSAPDAIHARPNAIQSAPGGLKTSPQAAPSAPAVQKVPAQGVQPQPQAANPAAQAAAPRFSLKSATLQARQSIAAAHGTPPAAVQSQPQAAQNPPARTNVPEETAEFSQTDVEEMWYRFAMELPAEQKALAGRMKIMKPLLTDGWRISVEVANRNVQADLEAVLPNLTGFLSAMLHNTRIRIQTSLAADDAEAVRYSPKETLTKFYELYPQLKEMQSALHLSII